MKKLIGAFAVIVVIFIAAALVSRGRHDNSFPSPAEKSSLRDAVSDADLPDTEEVPGEISEAEIKRDKPATQQEVWAEELARKNSCDAIAARPQPRQEAFRLQINETLYPDPVRLWIADNAETDESGLMCHKELGYGQGMLFVTPQKPGQGGVWMYQCYIPLDIVFIDDRGTIVDKVLMNPCLRLPRETSLKWYERCISEEYAPRVGYDKMLEISAKFGEKLNLKIGDRLLFHPN